MKIIELRAENFKKLVAVRIRPDGAMVQITGKNGEGKSSVLDALMAALGGEKVIPAMPIRIGTQKAVVRLDMGEIIVTRRFTATENGGYNSSITVENADGSRFASPQKMLDELLGKLTFDPLAFTNMKPREKFDTLRRLVPGIDFDAIDAQNKADYEARTDFNRTARERLAAADAIVLPGVIPEERGDEKALADELEKAATANTQLATREANRTQAKQKAEDLRKRAAEARAQADAFDKEAAELEHKLAAAEPLPKPTDIAAVRKQLDEARAANAALDAWERREALRKEAHKAEIEAEKLTKAMADRDKKKAAAIAAAKLPVEEIGFGDGFVTLNGVPFEQGSHAEQLTASIAIAMAMNPKLRVIRVPDGSLMDENSIRILGEMAEARGYQVWIERVDSSGKVGFVIEDGEVKAPAVAS